ncbi:11904_t:CDS:2 [Acaulospora colombiana]|uniref:11904_t:CDS:1 n=1 Tax=Acaulospora colombiana TaxID=27376 RepID=A0ACA9K8W3_9GLOM|nr:11904_t:CDS:2 [Acaulospora colombiana]
MLGGSVSALKWWPIHKLRKIDAVILTHPHADAINGLDDLRAWTLHEVIQDSIPIYLTNDTLDSVKTLFSYLVDSKQATGGGDLPKFQWHLIDSQTPFTVEGLEFTPLPEQAIDTTRNLNPIPKRTYLVGFSHAVEHYELIEELKMLQEKEPELWVRPAHDGLKVDIEVLSVSDWSA